EDGDDEKSEEDSIEYPTSGGDDDADDDLSEDDVDDEEEEDSSDNEEEEEEHLAPTVPAPALHSGQLARGARDTLVTLFGYQAKDLEVICFGKLMSSNSHATITYTSMSSYEVIVNGYYEMPMDPLDPYVQLVMEAPPSPDYIPGPEAPPSPDYIPRPEAPPSPDYIPGPEYPEYLPPADDVLPAEEQLLPAAISPTAESPGYITESEPEMEPEEENGDDEKSEEDDADDEDEEESSDSEEEEEEHLAPTVPAPAFESIPEADIPLRKRARFTTPTGGYKVDESSVAAAARQIRPVLTIADRHRADDRLIDRLKIERRYFCTLSTTYAQEVSHSCDYCTQIMDYCQSREVHTSTLVTQMEDLQRDVSTLQRHINDEDRLT
nr:hypothetical protein [Tanacetum cinerariifolium]